MNGGNRKQGTHAAEDPKLQGLDLDHLGHDGRQLTTDQGVKVDHTDDDSVTIGELAPRSRAGLRPCPRHRDRGGRRRQAARGGQA